MNQQVAGDSEHWTRARDWGFGHERLPVSDYVSQERFELERDRIFRRAWLAVARVEETPNPGDFIRRDIPTLRSQVLIVRGQDGVLRAFHNTCAHRGVALVCDQAGSTDSFRCPYHAWVYGTDGALRSLPAAAEFPHVDKERDGLAPIHLDCWNGFVFLNFADQPAQTLAEFLGEFGTQFETLPFADYPHVTAIKQDVDANWKHISNAFTEGYHLGVLHKKTLGGSVFTRENPFYHYYAPRVYGPHTAMTGDRNAEWSPSAPVLQFTLANGAPNPGAGSRPSIADHPGINPARITNFNLEVLNVFPNTQIQIVGDSFLWYQYWPLGPGKMHWEARIYAAAAPRTYAQEFAEAHIQAASRDVLTEDSSMSRLQQIGLESGGKTDIILGENELFLRFFATQLDAFIAS
jgi:phenylpropionate dioxygenase-like ring-hydroxylating dioxygenase large terminal subunit